MSKTIIEIIRETVDGESASLSPEATAALMAALIEREDEIVTHLRIVGERFGLMPQIVAKAVTVLGLGTQPDEETQKYIDHQYDEMIAAMKAAVEKQAEMYRAMGVEVSVAEFVDPMTATVSEVPDTAPEA